MEALTHPKTKQYLGFALGAVVALMMAASALMIGDMAHAQAMEADELFGGTQSQGGQAFAETAGLGTGDLPTTIATIIRAALGFLGIVAVVIILYGGFKWMTAGGQKEKVQDAKKIIIQGIIGLVIILSAFAIANFVIQQVTGAINAA